MTTNQMKAEAAVYAVLDGMVEGGYVLNTRSTAAALLDHLATHWDGLKFDEQVMLAGAVAALSLAAPELGPIGHVSAEEVEQAAARGAHVEPLPVGGLIHERQ